MGIQRDRVLACCDAEMVCRSLGIRLGRRNGDRIQMLCPFPDHNDHKFGNCQLNTSKKLFYCFACARGGTVIDAVMLHHGWDLNDNPKSYEAMKEVAEICGLDESQVSDGEEGFKRIPVPPSFSEKQIRFLGLYDDYVDVEDPETKEKRTINPLNNLRLQDEEGYCDLILRKAKEKVDEYRRRLKEEMSFVLRGHPVPDQDFQFDTMHIVMALQDAREIQDSVLKYLIRRNNDGENKGNHHKNNHKK